MTKTCKRCDYEWDSRSEFPKACPACKSYRWAVPVDYKAPGEVPRDKVDFSSLGLQTGRDLLNAKKDTPTVPEQEWIPNPKSYDAATGEDVWTERHYKTGKNREIKRETHYD